MVILQMPYRRYWRGTHAVYGRSFTRYQLLDARRAMFANTWKHREPADVIEFINRCNPPDEFKSQKAIITEAAHAFQVAKVVKSEGLVTRLEDAVQTLEIPSVPPMHAKPIVLRKILSVLTEWSSNHGGLPTLNREMCVSMAELGHDVTCAVLESSDAEKREAANKRVRLIDAPQLPTIEGFNRLLTLSKNQLKDCLPDLIIGHDHISVAPAQHLARNIFEVPYVHFVHTLPEGAERHKTRSSGSILTGAKKAEIQKRLCVESDLVVCVGPLLHRTMQTALQNHAVRVVEFRPGLNKALLSRKVDLDKILAIYCLFSGRLEDPMLKGADIACHIIASLNEVWRWSRYKKPLLIMRGFEEETIERDLAALGDIQKSKQYLLPRGYTANAKDVADDICSASMMVMPSRVEAFGLVALEAIAAGLPVLVTSSSGIGELLTILAAEKCPNVDACVTDVVDSDLDAIVRQWATKAYDILANPAQAFADADEMRSALAPILSWENAARKLTSDVEGVLVGHADSR
jgi:glycosyltransferase involved in cell wall biosynthesis